MKTHMKLLVASMILASSVAGMAHAVEPVA